ncbi:YdcF family protein [Brevibacillus sp. H7]|uniref:YdcF family protein n=1 Tax=Brevibacillus sp. H7 TaxID=3349138 RepID=UPI0038111C35
MSIATPWKMRFLFLLLVVLALLFIWFGYVLWRISQVEKAAQPRHADVAIVLGAAVWGEGPSPGLRERLDQALALYQRGFVPYLLVTGGVGEGKTISEAAVMQRYLMEQGVPEERILLENEARDTYQNLKYSKQLMEKHELQSALIVTHGYHLARALEMAKSLGITAYPVAVKSHVLKIPYYKTREVLAYTKWHLSQYISKNG